MERQIRAKNALNSKGRIVGMLAGVDNLKATAMLQVFVFHS